jgi:hypothetical protein
MKNPFLTLRGKIIAGVVALLIVGGLAILFIPTVNVGARTAYSLFSKSGSTATSQSGITTVNLSGADLTNVGTLTPTTVSSTNGTFDNISIDDGNLSLLLGAGNQLVIDAAATDNTGTRGVLEMDIDTVTANNVGLDVYHSVDANVDGVSGISVSTESGAGISGPNSVSAFKATQFGNAGDAGGIYNAFWANNFNAQGGGGVAQGLNIGTGYLNAVQALSGNVTFLDYGPVIATVRTTAGNGDNLSITAADANTSGNGGSVAITAGDAATSGPGGSISLDVGTQAGANAVGSVIFQTANTPFAFMVPYGASTTPSLVGSAVDGAEAVGIQIGALNSLVTSGAKIVSFIRSLADGTPTELAYIDRFGDYYSDNNTQSLSPIVSEFMPVEWGSDLSSAPGVAFELQDGITSSSVWVRDFPSSTDSGLVFGWEAPTNLNTTGNLLVEAIGFIDDIATSSDSGRVFHASAYCVGDDDNLSGSFGATATTSFSGDYDSLEKFLGTQAVVVPTDYAAGETCFIKFESSIVGDDYLSPVGIYGLKLTYLID